MKKSKPKVLRRLYQSLRWKIKKLLNPTIVRVGDLYVCTDARAKPLLGEGVYKDILRGIHEVEEREILKATIRPGDRVLEIGACLGIVGMEAARIVGEENVLSYEANPDLEWLIRKNHELNSLYPRVVLKAISKQGGSIKYYLQDNVTCSSVYSGEGCREIHIESTSLNQAIADFNPSILVMDAEGIEIQVLPEAEMGNIRALVIELHPSIIGMQGIALIEDALKKKGYTPTKRMRVNSSIPLITYELM